MRDVWTAKPEGVIDWRELRYPTDPLRRLVLPPDAEVLWAEIDGDDLVIEYEVAPTSQ